MEIIYDEIKTRIYMKKNSVHNVDVKNLIRYGDFHILSSDINEEDIAWMYVSRDKKEFIVNYYYGVKKANPSLKYIKLAGIDPKFLYKRQDNHKVYKGKSLLYFGLNLPEAKCDFDCIVYKFRAIE